MPFCLTPGGPNIGLVALRGSPLGALNSEGFKVTVTKPLHENFAWHVRIADFAT